jgi:tRNA U38,U39,U40 pseudouridine synthase TruA
MGLLSQKRPPITPSFPGGGGGRSKDHPSSPLVCGQITSISSNEQMSGVPRHHTFCKSSCFISTSQHTFGMLGPKYVSEDFSLKEIIMSAFLWERIRVLLSYRTMLQISLKSRTRIFQLAKRHLKRKKAEK